MATYRELVYIVLDELKIQSDDSYFEVEHVLFLINSYRSFLLKQRYADVRKEIPETNYQSVIVPLIEVPAVPGDVYTTGNYMRTTVKLPSTVNFNGGLRVTNVSSSDYWTGEFSYIGRDRFKYVGYNKWLQSTIYCALGTDGYLYFKSSNEAFKNIPEIKYTSIFENPLDNLLQPKDNNGKLLLDTLDLECPMESNLISPLVKLICAELLPSISRITDTDNDAYDGVPDDYNKNARAQQALTSKGRAIQQAQE